MKQIHLLSLFTLIVTFVGCGQSSTNGTNSEVDYEISENWKSIDETDYSIQYPKTFILDKSGQMGMEFILFSEQTSAQDLFRENINLMIQDLSGQNMDLNKYVDISENQIKTMVTEVNLMESKRLTINNKEVQRVIFTGKQGQFDLKWLQFYWVENNKSYVLTLTCEIKQYDNHALVGEQIMKTFTIK
jgi:hypothetical protein